MLGALSLALLAPLFFLSRSFRLTPSFAFMFVHKTTKKKEIQKQAWNFLSALFTHTHTWEYGRDSKTVGECEREGSGKGKGKERAAVATYFCFHFVLHFCYAAFVVFFSTRLHISIFHIFVSPNLLYDFCDVAKSHLRLLQKFHLFTFYAHVQNNNNNKWDIKKKLLRNKCRKSKTVFFSTRFLALILCLPFIYISFESSVSFSPPFLKNQWPCIEFLTYTRTCQKIQFALFFSILHYSQCSCYYSKQLI